MDNWKDSLPEDIREAGALKNFESLEDLAKSHIEAQKTISQRPASISGEEPAHDFFDKVGKSLGIKDDIGSYKTIGNDAISKVAQRYKIHPRQLKPFLEDVQPELDRLSSKQSESKQAEYAEGIKYLEKEFKDHDLLRAKTAKKLGVSLKKLEEELGPAYNTPRVQHLILALGSGGKTTPFQGDSAPKTTDTHKKTDAGEDGDERKTMQQKLDYINDMQREGTPYYDEEHKEHKDVRKKVAEYTKDLAKYQREHKETINLYPRG